jgi:hypothetical protein
VDAVLIRAALDRIEQEYTQKDPALYAKMKKLVDEERKRGMEVQQKNKSNKAFQVAVANAVNSIDARVAQQAVAPAGVSTPRVQAVQAQPTPPAAAPAPAPAPAPGPANAQIQQAHQVAQLNRLLLQQQQLMAHTQSEELESARRIRELQNRHQATVANLKAQITDLQRTLMAREAGNAQEIGQLQAQHNRRMTELAASSRALGLEIARLRAQVPQIAQHPVVQPVRTPVVGTAPVAAPHPSIPAAATPAPAPARRSRRRVRT